ncbi:MAG: response regulator receiver domain [Bacteroidales bacterium]|jgi:hypothetical protein|nr:response regulator receiver domain [Bacteroidales bacterium]
MSFSELATQIVMTSIRSAICIDDQFAEPYEETKEFDTNYPKRLYNSFKNQGECLLDFYRYKSLEGWKSDSKRVLSNKDLIILDWELEEDNIDCKYRNTLFVLDDIVNNGANQFVVIYTNQPELGEISGIVQSFYDKVNLQVPVSADEKIVDLFEKEGNDYSSLDDAIERSINVGNIFTTKTKLFALLVDAGINRQDIGTFIRESKVLLNLKYESDVVRFLALKHFKLRSLKAKEPRAVFEIFGEYKIINIDDTLVLIVNKESAANGITPIAPDNLFKSFQNAVIKKPNNAMAIMACELKDLIRSNAVHIGSRISQIDEKAFYYQWKNLREGVDIEEKDADRQFRFFLLHTWLNELSQFTLNVNSGSNFFDALKLYGEEKGLFDNMEDDNLSEELIKLGAIYSTINIASELRSDKKIQFGDIFLKRNGNGSTTEVLMSVTSHCDSLRPKKIDNMLYFVKGEIEESAKNKKKALIFSEKDYYSFLFMDDKPIVIEWKLKPFSLFVTPNSNNVNHDIHLKYQQKNIILRYLTTLKENYTQRIANHSFGEAMRVGITLPCLKDDK